MCKKTEENKNGKAMDNLTVDQFVRLEEIYKLFGSIPRLRMLIRLSAGEATASELTEAAKLTPSATSHQLKDLKACRIVRSRKEGQRVYYSLDDVHVMDILEIGIEHIKHTM